MEEKHRIIVQEIEKWRRNRLLPEQYCDFLQNLYRDPEEDPRKVFGVSADKIVQARPRTWFLMIVSTGIIFYIALYFSSFPMPMQIAVSALIVLVLFLIGKRQRNKRPTFAFLSYWTGAIAAPAAALYIMQQQNAPVGAYAPLLLLVAAFWVVTGILTRYAALQFSGWAAAALLYGWLIKRLLPDADLLRLQLSWLPLGVLLGWIGTLLVRRFPQNGRVLLLTGAGLWFAPEAYGLITTELPPVMLQLMLTVKLVTAGTALYLSRKKWIEWIGF
ncbi:hypothetical protein [Gorillibacterium sp. CAU 1737]|uniref:hypothetical protein n=1 Tax=Gorillibacterium sp. CAU 1737 TaxID=3140362 RepID=UPI0032607D47